jgi:hypothetical protein
MKIDIHLNPSQDGKDVVIKNLVGFSDSKAGDARHREFGLFACDGSESIIGGALGFTLCLRKRNDQTNGLVSR